MQIIGMKFSPGKGRWPKSKAKQAQRRYLLQAASEYNKAVQRKHGSQGAASDVRHIDPASIDVGQYLK